MNTAGGLHESSSSLHNLESKVKVSAPSGSVHMENNSRDYSRFTNDSKIFTTTTLFSYKHSLEFTYILPDITDIDFLDSRTLFKRWWPIRDALNQKYINQYLKI